jgi:TatD DNase family protein
MLGRAKSDRNLYYVDMHAHCTELKDLDKYRGEYLLVCVSDDLESSSAVLRLVENYEYVKPCIGVHPWVAHEFSARDVENSLRKLINRAECLGEVGLDKKFKPETFEKQLEIFNIFVNYAKEYDMVLNLHAAGAWDDVFHIVNSKNINKAYFHWYTGPLHLADQIVGVGYFIGANPALLIQEKHRVVLDYVSLENIITESDSPYYYRGLNLTPELVKEVVLYLSKRRGLHPLKVKEAIYENFKKLFK